MMLRLQVVNTEQGTSVEYANKIQLLRGDNCWLAKHTGPHAARIIELFNTDTLPLPYTLEASSTLVLSELVERNPGVGVFILVGV